MTASSGAMVLTTVFFLSCKGIEAWGAGWKLPNMYSARYERTRIKDRVPTQYPLDIALHFDLISNRLAKCLKC